MTDDEQFEEIATGFTSSNIWRGAVKQATAELHFERPGGIDVTVIGHRAWKKLTPIQQAEALPDLFGAYIVLLGERERAEQLAAFAATHETALEGDDEYLLQDALSGVAPISESTTVDGVCASALSNVLDELNLLRQRLAKTEDS
jgi:hypothetical protein